MDGFELAAALVSLLGEPIPHSPAADAEAVSLRGESSDDRRALLKAAELCGRPYTAAQFYLCTKIYSWLGREYDGQTIQCAEACLSQPLWEALPTGTREQEGVTVDLSAHARAGIFADLAGAYAGTGQYDKACSAYMRAYELEPYSVNYAIEVSNVLVLLGRPKEAMDFLIQQRKSPCRRVIRYRDQNGAVRFNSSFRDILDRQILCLQKRFDRNGG